jgi:membrane protease YdiL (CAAX protease family)
MPHTGEVVHAALVFEFLLLFVILPLAFAVHPLPWWPLPALWMVALYCYLVLRRQPDFNPREFWRVSTVAASARSILTLFLPAACLLALAVYALRPHLFLNLPRQRPLLWCVVMLLYPILSVVPQTLIYRAFIFHRYPSLFPSGRALILASAASFSWLHIVLRNPLAPLLTFPAGLLFAWRYARTGSVLASAFEHALYGCLVFTVGLGVYFYTGAVR